jgi:putative MATE family efflux protein
MTGDPVGRLIVKLSFPAMAGSMVYALFSLIDTFFVSKLGPRSLAAMTLCIPIEVLMVSVGSATGAGITSILSRSLGRQDIKLADNIAWHGLIISIIYGLLFSWLGAANVDDLLLLFGCRPEIFVLCKQYLFLILVGSLFTFVPMIAGHILQGEGNTFLPMLTSIVCIILNVVFDPLFIFGLGPVRPMGIRGAAMATILAQMVSTVIIIHMLFKKSSWLTWSLHNFRPSLKVMAAIYRVGLPALVMEILSVGVMAFLNRLVAGYSYTAVAALGVFMRVRSLFYMQVHGLAQGVMPVAGFAYGARKNERVKETIIKASVIAIIIMSVAWLLMQYHAVWIMTFFSHDPVLSGTGVSCMHLATVVLPVMGPIIILYTVLQAVGKDLWLCGCP